MTSMPSAAPKSRAAWLEEPEPAWDIARLFPAQGQWTETDYLALDTNRLVEFSHGVVDVLAMTTQTHQFIALFLYRALLAFVEARRLGEVLAAPLRVRLWPGKIRQPDVVFMHREHDDRRGELIWEGADLVMEVVSEDRDRDLIDKRREYARAGIPEYWIVDPRDRQISILRLDGDQYGVHGVFVPGERATSALLPGFSVEVERIFAAAR